MASCAAESERQCPKVLLSPSLGVGCCLNGCLNEIASSPSSCTIGPQDDGTCIVPTGMGCCWFTVPLALLSCCWRGSVLIQLRLAGSFELD